MRAYMIPFIVGGALAVTSCAVGEPQSAPSPLTEKQAKQLDKLLKGKVAGTPVKCISNFGNTSTIRISDDMLIYRGGRKLVYQNNLRNTCPGLADDDEIMVIRNAGSSYCDGDQFQLVDRFSGIQGPICRFGKFVPYRPSDDAG